jgi:hypothetical protein
LNQKRGEDMNCCYFNNQDWVRAQWGNASFGDARRNARAQKLALSILNKPDASLPYQAESWGELKAGYRLLNSNKVTFETVQKGHWANVRQMAKKSKKTVLYIQDKSDIDFSSKKATKGLGPIGNHKGQGIILQSVLAVEFDKIPITVIGLAYQKAWIRPEQSYRKKETRSDLYKRPTEADYWIETLKLIGDPDGTEAQFVTIGDRENDNFKFFSYCGKSGWNFLVRANNNRKVFTETSEEKTLADWARSLPEQTTKEIELRARPGKPARQALLSIAWGTIFIKTPKNGVRKSEREVLKVSCIRVWEQASDELEWLLITNLESSNKEEALEKVGWYEARWLIEEYHKCLKTGCAIEKRQLQTSEGLLAILGFLGIIATRLLAIKFFAKQNPQKQAKKYFPPLGIQLLCTRYKLSPDKMTCQQYWHSIARLGGFIGRKSDGNPGWQTLWKGWTRFLDMIHTLEAFTNYKPGSQQDQLSPYQSLWTDWERVLDRFIVNIVQ